jgi:hypothetical protein
MSAHSPKAGQNPYPADRDELVQQILDALRGLRYGAVNIVLQDGVVVQIDRIEKRRVRCKAEPD